jgi:geranylgeranyl pyrophosphate synthase
VGDAVNDLFDIIRSDLSLVEDKLHEGTGGMFFPLAQGMAQLLDSGGKRLRPALVLLASRFHSGTPIERVVSLAAAVETLHTATLVHDDLIDGALFRRGRRTLSATWNKATTVLAGDYLFARAAHFAAETENTRVVSIFAKTLMTICDGELRQLFGAFDLDQDLDSYYVRIFSKTASLFAGATEAAAVLVEANPSTVDSLRDYGRYLGMSFQIQDDILDFVGDERVMGKPTGSDLRQGIVTLPVYYFLREHPEPEEWKDALKRQGDARDASH